jgi:hypothetical protein
MKWFLRLFDRFTRGKQPASRGLRRAPRRWTPALEHLEDRLQPSVSSIASNFNGTPIPAGSSVWFNSVLKVSGLGSQPVTLKVVNATINFATPDTSYNVSVPSASITFSPSATTATTTFDATSNTWVTTVPSKLGGNTFLAGVALPLPNGLPGGVKPVTWQADFQSGTSGISVNWQWAAAVYTNFSTDYTAVAVKPVDDNQASSYQNSDHAGTPEPFKSYVIGGATGGGGSNWSGSYSGTASVTPSPIPLVVATSSLSGTVFDSTSPPWIPLQGATVTLTGTTNTGASVYATVSTDSNGYYSFTGLLPGTYTLTEAPPSDYANYGAWAGNEGGTVNKWGSSIASISLPGGVTGVNYNFADIYWLPNS